MNSRALLVGALIALMRARAEADPLAIAWVRAEGAERCPDGAALRARVGERLGRAPDPAPNAIEVVASRAENVWSARVFVRDGQGALTGERALQTEGNDCEQLVAAVSLVVALVIDPEAALRPATPAVAGVQAAPVTPSRLRIPTVTRRRVEVSGGAVASVAVLPRVAAGVSLDVWAPWSTRWAVAVGARWLPEVSSGPVALGLVAFRAGPCWTALQGVTGALRVCADLRVGALHAAVRGDEALVADDAGQRVWAGAALSVVGRARVWRWLFVSATLEAQTPFTRDVFVITRRAGAEEVFQQPPISALGVFSVGASI